MRSYQLADITCGAKNKHEFRSKNTIPHLNG
jgi:hypothetical protein